MASLSDRIHVPKVPPINAVLVRVMGTQCVPISLQNFLASS